MNHRFSTVLEQRIARGPKTASQRFALWLMVLTVLAFTSFIVRNANAQSANPTPMPAQEDALCSPFALSPICGHIEFAADQASATAANRPSTNPSPKFDFTLPELGAKGAQSHTVSQQAREKALFAPVLHQLMQAGQLAGSGLGLSDLATGYLTSQANQYVFGGLQRWLSQYGTASISMGATSHGLNDGSANMLLPLYDNKGSALLFTQLGYQRWDGRNTINLGLGARHFDKHSMYGANVFFDDDVTGHNQRLGAGLEFGTDYLHLAANGYFGLTGWHQSRDYADYDERPASGFDVATEMYLPALPQLGMKLKYEQYFGNGVDLAGDGSRQKNPLAVTAQLDYTPVPAITIGAGYRRGSRGISDVLFNTQLTYRMGVPLSEQFDPHAVASMRSVAASRYALVQRNNRIVLDYRKRVVIRLTLAQALNGYPGEVMPLPVNVTSTYGLQSIQWNAPEFMANGGAILGQNGSYTLTFPAYQSSGSNTYVISAVARDREGNTSSPAQMHITVQPPVQNISIDKSTTDISPNRIYADGHSTALVTISVLDGNGNGVPGLAHDIVLQPAFNTSPQAAAAVKTTSPAILGPTISAVSAQGDGIYLATITAGTELGTLTVTPIIKTGSIKLKSAAMQFVSANTAVNAALTDPIVVTPQAGQAADGQAAYTFTAHVVDANTGNPLPNYPLVGLRWQVNPSPGSLPNAGWLTLTPGSSTTDASGNISATLSSKMANTAFTVSAQLGSAAPHNANPVTFSLVARIASVTIVDPSTGITEIGTINNLLNTPIRLHTPVPLGSLAQAGFQYVALVVDARGLPVANQSLSTLGFQWMPSRSPTANDAYYEAPTTNGAGQAIAYFASFAQVGTTGPFTASAKLGSQVVRPAKPANVGFTDVPGDTHQIQYVQPNGNVYNGAVWPDTRAIAFVKDVTYARFDPGMFVPTIDQFVSAVSSAPNVVSVDPATGRMNALKPGQATISETYAHNGYRFTRSVTLNPQVILFVEHQNGQTIPIVPPWVDPDPNNTCEGWSNNAPGIASVDIGDVKKLTDLVPQTAFGNSFWGQTPPVLSSRRFYLKDSGAQRGWDSLPIPGNGGVVLNDNLDGSLVCKLQ
ncbi:inverse autotransporter beta domain-containing protein [Trinickia sp. LjRoot230]|uniref:inverse autotransporter beta domain-containing protein n=1 Tax=Trinickia sp. LjRoot230 TaxID=3342288 RepID=UPI003ECF2B10